MHLISPYAWVSIIMLLFMFSPTFIHDLSTNCAIFRPFGGLRWVHSTKKSPELYKKKGDKLLSTPSQSSSRRQNPQYKTLDNCSRFFSNALPTEKKIPEQTLEKKLTLTSNFENLAVISLFLIFFFINYFFFLFFCPVCFCLFYMAEKMPRRRQKKVTFYLICATVSVAHVPKMSFQFIH